MSTCGLLVLLLSHVLTSESFLQDSLRSEIRHHHHHLRDQLQQPCHVVNGAAELKLEPVGSKDVHHLHIPVIEHHPRLLLKLRHNPQIDINAPTVFHEQLRHIPLSGHHVDARMYHDPDNWASLTVWSVPVPPKPEMTAPRPHYYYAGSFVHSGNEYVLAPDVDRFSPNSPHAALPHVIYYKRKMLSEELTVQQQQQHPKLRRVRRSVEEDDFTNFIGTGLFANTFQDGTLMIEMRLLLDVTVYKYWMRRTNNDIVQATKQMKIFFSYIANSADLVYRRMKTVKVAIYLLDYEIFTTSVDSYFTVNHVTNGKSWLAENFSKVPIDGKAVIVDVDQWIKKDKNRRSADHVSVMTLMNMPDAVGLSVMYQGCRSRPISLIEANGQVSWDTLAHELGHNYGASHDGTGFNGCKSNDRFIMTPSGDVFTKQNIKNGYRFSKCSEEEIKWYLSYLDGVGMNCLRKLECGNYNAPTKYLDVLPGLMYTLDHQCEFKMSGTGFCNTGDDICVALYCSYPTTRKECIGGSGLRATSGTPCGNKKWCKLGTCVHDKNAPEIKGSFRNFKGLKSDKDSELSRDEEEHSIWYRRDAGDYHHDDDDHHDWAHDDDDDDVWDDKKKK